MYASESKLSIELKNSTEILVGQVVLSHGSKQSKYVLISNARTAWPI